MIRSAVLLVLAIGAGSAVAQEGCGLPIVRGVTGNTVFLGLENLPSGVVAWRVGASDARRLHFKLPGRLLPTQDGTGPEAWMGSVDPAGLVHVFQLSASGALAPQGSLRPLGIAAAMTWAADASEHAWIILATIENGQRRLEAFRQERFTWKSKGHVAAADLHIPRPVPDSRSSIMCGAWQFSSRRAPHRLPVDGNADLVETYPSRGAVIVFRLDDLTVLTSRDSGRHWRVHRAPAAGAEVINWTGETPTVRWLADGRVHVATFAP